MTHAFHDTILREYDIRGIIGETLSDQDAYALGRAFGDLVQQRTGGGRICVGRDGRLSSPMLEQALMDGLQDVGCHLLSIGLGPTPALYFAQQHVQAHGAVQVTGSHNPPNHNGFKMMLGGKPFFGDDIRQLARQIPQSRPGGTRQILECHGDYLQALLGGLTGGGRPLCVVWDPGNGAAGELVEQLVTQLPGQHVVINAAIDGHFPNHHPDPTDPETLEQLRQSVAAHGADLGLAFDGDGDRLGVIDQRGRILWGDQYMVLLAQDVLTRHPGAPIIADVKASQVLFDQIAALGGQPVMGRTGHSLVKTLMAELKAPLAGEMSGHIFFADGYYGFDDALYAAVRLLSVASRLPDGLANWFDQLPQRVNTPELRFDCPESRKVPVIQTVHQMLEQQGASFSAIDGVRVQRPDGWWLLRASNTQAVLVARAESDSQQGLQTLLNDLQNCLHIAGINLPHGMSAHGGGK